MLALYLIHGTVQLSQQVRTLLIYNKIIIRRPDIADRHRHLRRTISIHGHKCINGVSQIPKTLFLHAVHFNNFNINIILFCPIHEEILCDAVPGQANLLTLQLSDIIHGNVTVRRYKEAINLRPHWDRGIKEIFSTFFLIRHITE